MPNTNITQKSHYIRWTQGHIEFILRRNLKLPPAQGMKDVSLAIYQVQEPAPGTGVVRSQSRCGNSSSALSSCTRRLPLVLPAHWPACSADPPVENRTRTAPDLSWSYRLPLPSRVRPGHGHENRRWQVRILQRTPVITGIWSIMIKPLFANMNEISHHSPTFVEKNWEVLGKKSLVSLFKMGYNF